MKKSNLFLSFFVVYLIINMVIAPKLYISATYNGVLAWAINVLPSVLPFMFFTKLLTSLGVVEKYSSILSKPYKKLFNCPSTSAFVFFTSILSGYPVGAIMTADLYHCGKITKSEAFRMCSFCSTSGPMFIIGAVGTNMLGNSNLGYIIFLSHLLGALLNGILYRNLNIPPLARNTQPNQNTRSISFQNLIQDSVLSILSVGAIIAIFFAIITSFAPIFNLFPPQISCMLEGLIEITKGCISISNKLSGSWQVIAITFIISFGGLSTILQSIAMLDKLQMPLKLFVRQKTTHALLSMGCSTIFCFLFL